MKSFDSKVAEKPAMNSFDSEIGETARWLPVPRFEGITRLYSARQVVEQRGTIPTDYTVARMAAGAVLRSAPAALRRAQADHHLRPLFTRSGSGLKRMGIEGIYLGGWATSARGSVTEDPGPDLASYPLSQVPDEAAPIVRALLTADRNQRFARSRLSEAQRAASPEIDYRPFIIADADTDTAATRTSGIWSVVSSRSGSRATTSRTRSRAPRSAGTREGKCSSAWTSRSSG
jgi:Isocitrate lyase